MCTSFIASSFPTYYSHSIMMQANEDGNCYSYDLRKLNEATMVHTDHAAAVYDGLCVLLKSLCSSCLYFFLSFVDSHFGKDLI